MSYASSDKDLSDLSSILANSPAYPGASVSHLHMNYAVSDRDLSSILANTPAHPGRYTNSVISLH